MNHTQSSTSSSPSSVDCPPQMEITNKVDITTNKIQVLGSKEKRRSSSAKQAPAVAPVDGIKMMKATREREKRESKGLPPLGKKEAKKEFVASYLAQNLPLDRDITVSTDFSSAVTSPTRGSSSKPSRTSCIDQEANLSPAAIALNVSDRPPHRAKIPKRRKIPTATTMAGIDDDVDDDEISRLSVTEMKALVLESLPPSVLDQIPANAWDRIFSENQSVMSEESPFLQRVRSGCKDDVSDIASVISHVVSRRGLGGNASVTSNVSALTDPFCRSDEFKTYTKPVPLAAAPPTDTIVRSVRAPEPSKSRETNGRVTTGVPAVVSLSSSSSEQSANVDNQNSIDLRRPSVRFAQVSVREYSSVLTVNPAVSCGPSIGLGWDHAPDDEKYTVEDFEQSRVSARRDSNSLQLPRAVREEMVLSLGYSQRDIADSIRMTTKVKNQRKQTVQNLHASSMEEFLERTTRRLKRILFFPGRRQSSRQQQVW
jgi:hypothetical protein